MLFAFITIFQKPRFCFKICTSYVWWNLHLGLAYDYLKKFDIAKKHLDFVKKFLKQNHLSKIKFAFTKQNQHLNTYPYITNNLKKYGFE